MTFKRVIGAVLFFLPGTSLASNPLVLTEAADKATDMVILGSSISDLASEVGVSGELVEELNQVRKESQLVRDQIYLSKAISQEAYGLTNPKISSHGKLAYDIDNVTRYIRRAKNLGAMIMRLGGRPEAAAAASLQETNHLLFSILQNQERLALADERRLISSEREELERPLAFAEFIDAQAKKINEHADRITREHRAGRSSLFGG